MFKVLIGGAIFSGIVYLVRRVVGTPRVPSDVVDHQTRIDTLIEGTRQKPW